jgi:hypothetical protein
MRHQPSLHEHALGQRNSAQPTPWLGLFERLSIAPWLLWMAVLAVMLLTVRYTEPVGAGDTALDGPLHRARRRR